MGEIPYPTPNHSAPRRNPNRFTAFPGEERVGRNGWGCEKSPQGGNYPLMVTLVAGPSTTIFEIPRNVTGLLG